MAKNDAGPDREGADPAVYLLIVGAVAVLIALGMLVSFAARGTDPSVLLPGPGLAEGGEATVTGGGAWFAADNEAWERMLVGQNAGSGKLLGPLIREGRVFREPNGARVLVVKKGLGGVLARVTEGVNGGREGWVQRELLLPAP